MTKGISILKRENFKVNSSAINITFIWVLLFLSWGGTLGRFSFGLSFFDFFLIPALTWLVIKRKISISKSLYLLIFLIIYGTIIIPINYYIFITPKTYQYYITEVRFYLYIPLLFIYIENSKSINKIKLFFIINSILFIVIYLLDKPGTFIYNYFNEAILNTNIEDSFIKGDRVVGLPIIPLTAIMIVHILDKTLKPYIIIIYSLTLALFYFKTGSRTNLLFGSLPFILLIFESNPKKKFFITLSLAFILLLLLSIMEKDSLQRLSAIFHPLSDPSVNYRVLNYMVMMNDFINNPFNLIFGYGIGSNYIVNLSFHIESFFLDNTFLTVIYKVGIIGLIILLLFIRKEISGLAVKYKIIFSLLLLIPAISSYHAITQPAYFMTFFIVNKVIRESKNNFQKI